MTAVQSRCRRAAAFALALVFLGCATPRPVDMLSADCPPPTFAADAHRQAGAGVTIVRVTVDPSGQVTDAKTFQPSGTTAAHRALDDAAVVNALVCRFPEAKGHTPATADKVYTWRRFVASMADHLPKSHCLTAGAVNQPDCAEPSGTRRALSSVRAEGCVVPEYPFQARRADATGNTVLTLIVEPSGETSGAVVSKSSGPTHEQKLLDEAAVLNAATCRYPPAPGTIATRVTRTYQWKLVP